jgi:hypothetical protein
MAYRYIRIPDDPAHGKARCYGTRYYRFVCKTYRFKAAGGVNLIYCQSK